ncbi:hypothetical protein E1178_04315 [Roseibium hamelinense]|uniref:DUF6030 family protein n=1 Tax=Roseibium hamelinense TaxID=150831 RepID=UPI00119D95AF|nr:DUF6030 family protein [Roseibium hamelinense]MTI42827.1 hypothetical protein [Roseibium hamelinense]
MWRKSALISLPLVLLALAAAGYGIAVSVWQPPAVPDPPRAADPLATLDPGLRTELTQPTPVLPARLRLTFTGEPQALCDQLKELGLENRGWQRAPFQRGRWQCASDLVQLTTPSVDFGPSTLFFLLRGPDETSIDYLRLKLVVEDPAQKPIGIEAVNLVITELSARYAWAVPDALLQAVSQFQALEMEDRGVRLRVAPEDPELTGDPLASQRLNIVLDFSEPELIRPASGFEKPVGQRPAAPRVSQP